MSNWLDELKRQKEIRDNEKERQIAEKQKQKQLYEESDKFKAIQSHKVAFEKFYRELNSFASEAGRLTQKYLGKREIYSDLSGFYIEGPKVEVIPWKQGNHYTTALFNHQVFRCSRNYFKIKDSFFFGHKTVSRELFNEFHIKCEIEDGRYSDSDRSIDWTRKSSKTRDKIISVSEVNEQLYEKISKWLIFGEKFI